MLRSLAGAVLLCAAVAPAAGVRTPAEVYASRPNFLADLPAGWERRPVQLQVLFNLKAAPGSAEAEAFLAEYARFERSLPYGGRVEIGRVAAPTAFRYVGRLTFPDWQSYRRYEESAAFRDWYVRVWKPAVSGLDELFVVLGDPLK